MKLAYHYLMESQGRQTFTAQAIKSIARGWYYRKMAVECQDSGIVKKLEKVDREVKDLQRVSPHDDRNTFRRFLVCAKDEAGLEERIRLLREVALQLRLHGQQIQAYEIDAPGEIRSQLELAAQAIEKFDAQTLRQFHLLVHQNVERKDAYFPRQGWLGSGIIGELEPSMSKVEVGTCTSLTIRISKIEPATPAWGWDVELAKAKRRF